MDLVKNGEGLLRRPPVENGPTVTVLFGGEPEGPEVGVVKVNVPPGGGMPEHVHGGSDVVLMPVVGTVVIAKGSGEESVTVEVGDAALVRRDEAVSLRNPGTEAAEVVVAAGPANFVAGIRRWPAPAPSV